MTSKREKSDEEGLTVTEIKNMKVAELKEELKKRSLPVSGKKDELVERLTTAIQGGASEEASAPPAKKQKQEKSKESKTEKSNDNNNNEQTENAGEEGSSSLLDSLKDEGWKEILSPEFKKPYFQGIIKFLDQEKKNGVKILPPLCDVFNAFNYTPFDKVRVVIIGQDPYFNEGQAHGLCFSVRKGVKVPPSLNMIYKELDRSIPGFKAPKHGYLESWAKQGILLLNATLTVQPGKPNSHAKCGWQEFTDRVIDIINEKKENIVFLLWGGFAQKKGKNIDTEKHHVLESPHPSPMSGGGFVGCNCFAETNKILKDLGGEPINWTPE